MRYTELLPVGSSFYPVEPKRVEPKGVGVSECLEINMLRYIARRAYVCIHNPNSTNLAVVIRRTLFDLEPEDIVDDTIQASKTKCYNLEGIYVFSICVDKPARVAYVVESMFR